MSREHDQQDAGNDPMLLDHNYDGIQEFDNPTPGWWHVIFIGSVIFAILYVQVYMFGPGSSEQDKYNVEVAQHYERLFADVGDLEPNEETILRIMHEDDLQRFMPVAEAIFTSKCAACHGALGQGGTGPNMTDDAYLHVKNLEDIGTVILEGARAGAMPAWEKRLHPNQITLLAAYVAKLRGTNVPGKMKEGEVPAPWPEYEPGRN